MVRFFRVTTDRILENKPPGNATLTFENLKTILDWVASSPKHVAEPVALRVHRFGSVVQSYFDLLWLTEIETCDYSEQNRFFVDIS